MNDGIKRIFGQKLAESFLMNCEELQRLLTASIKTAKSNLNTEVTN
jgi:hypothetical protein